jgi:hypothetical protein
MPRGPRGEKRPADVIGNAVMVAKIATGELVDNREEESAAAALAQGTQTHPGNGCRTHVIPDGVNRSDRANRYARASAASWQAASDARSR